MPCPDLTSIELYWHDGMLRSRHGSGTPPSAQCQCYGSHFDITTGAVLREPATEPFSTYEAREVDGQIQVRVLDFNGERVDQAPSTLTARATTSITTA